MRKQKKENRMPVLFILPTLGTGGSERVVFNLCKNADPIFFPVVAAFRDGALKREMKETGIPVHVLNRRNGIDLTLIFKLIRLIRKYRIQVVNTHHFVSLFYGFWATYLTRTPIMHTEHSKWEMDKLSSFWNWWFIFFLKKIEIVSAVSPAAYSHIQEVYGVEEKRLSLVLNGIDVNLFRKGNPAAILRESLSINANDTIIGTVGNLRTEKNQALLIKALSLLNDSEKSYKALLVGDGPLRLDLEKLAIELGVEKQVLFLGTRNDVPFLYGVMDIYCLPSRFEGLPLTLLEAMSSGVPVIGTDVLGIREVISHKETGILVPDNDCKQLSEAIEKLACNEKQKYKLSKNGHRTVCEQYSFSKFIRKYEDLFFKLS